MKEFSMPKTTIWHHIHNIKLSNKHIAIIRSKQGGNKIKSQRNWERVRKQAKEIFNSGNKYPCALLAMLYWVEGNKKNFVFTNTDGRMIKFYLVILKKYFNINKSDIKIIIRVFENLNIKECLKYWSNILELPKEKFSIYINDGGKRGKAQYGICRLSIKKAVICTN